MYPRQDGYWTCAVRAREAARRSYWRRHWDDPGAGWGGARANSGPKPPTPLNRLWLSGEAVLEFIGARYGTLAAAATYLNDSCGGRSQPAVALYRLRTNPNWLRWIRYDTADRLLCALGMVVSELDTEPAGSNSPTSRPMEA